MAAFTLAHLSDPHLPPLPAARLRDLAGKRALGYLNWTRNRHKYHRRDVLDALVADMQGQRPDRFAATFGDYLRGDAGGEPPSFPFVRRRGPIALIGVSSAVPTPPLMATGWLGLAQLRSLERTLAQLAAEDAVSVLL